MIYRSEKTVSYDDICLVPAFSDLQSRSEANIKTLGCYQNPIVNSPMIHTSSVNIIRYFIANNMMCTVHRYFKCAVDQLQHVKAAVGEEYDSVFFSVGKSREWIDSLIHNGVRKFVVDMAHGHSTVCGDTVKYIKKQSPNAYIIAGNVATAEGYRYLRKCGAHGIRAGIAGGSICSTAKNTAFGVPIVTTILDCKEAKDDVGGLLIADGGIRSAADILKAVACGADLVFCGKLLASTNLAQGMFRNTNLEYTDLNGLTWSNGEPQYAEYAGMASHEMRMRNGSHDTKNVSIEGVAGLIKYTGATHDVIENINANLKAGLSYCGARNWKEFYEKVIIREMSTAGIVEKETHLDR